MIIIPIHTKILTATATKKEDDDLVGNVELNFKPLKWLNIMDRVSVTLSQAT